MVFMRKTTPDFSSQVLDRWTMERQIEVTSLIIFFYHVELSCAAKDLKPSCAVERTNKLSKLVTDNA